MRMKLRILKPARKTDVRLKREIDRIKPEKRAKESLSLSLEPAKTMGSTGKTHGERIG